MVRQALADRPLDAHAQGGRVLVVGAGKAAAGMAAGVEEHVGTARAAGIVVTAPGCGDGPRAVRVVFGSHPLPDRRSLEATAALTDVLGREAGIPIVCLISGGASSLLVQPRPPVSLADKLAVHRLLLESGADIESVNTVRKHLSMVKGGGLLRLAGGRTVRTLVLSDVVGDDPSVIGSGPSVPDPTTHADALAVLDRHGLRGRVPKSVRALLEAGARGTVADTLKPDDLAPGRVDVAVIGSNRVARAAAARRAAALGYEPIVDHREVVGDTAAAARRWARQVAARPADRRWCAIAGGETTVVVRGQGRGGRNQEFALVAAQAIDGMPIALLSAGTDGIDGPTDAAGALADGLTIARARALGLDPAGALADNDCHPFFDRLGDLLRTGPTGTNVMDLKLAVQVGSAS